VWRFRRLLEICTREAFRSEALARLSIWSMVRIEINQQCLKA